MNSEKYLLAVVTCNRPGVLSRIAGLLRRKLFNIDSLTVGRTQNTEESHFTVVIEGDLEQAQKAAKLIDRLVEVRSVKVLRGEDCLRREIVLARFRVRSKAQAEALYQAEKTVFSKELSWDEDVVTVELIDTSQALDHLLQFIGQSEIEVLEWVRSGVIALER